MISIYKLLSSLLVLNSAIGMVKTLDVDCKVLVESPDALCNMLVNNSACWEGTCQCIEGFRENLNGECIEDQDEVSKQKETGIGENYEWMNTKVETETIVQEEIKSKVYEMELPNIQEATDADEYLERYRRQDQGGETSGEDPASASLLLSYGSSEQDSSIERSNDGCTQIHLDFKIPFLRNTGFNNFYICVNGIISFGTPFASAEPPRNKEQADYLSNRYIACPYFADIDISSIGSVWYNMYSVQAGNLGSTSTVKQTVKQHVNDIFDPEFSPLYVLKVTWAGCPQSGRPTDETVAFQMVYATNLNDAYMFYTYDNGEMKFTDGRQFIGYVNDGLPVGIADSLDSTLLKKPDQFINFNQRNGFVAYTVATSTDPNSENDCLTWLDEELQYAETYESVIENDLPVCPCSQAIAQLLDAFILVSEEGGTATYAVAPSENYAPYGQTCTYKKNGFIRSSSKNVGRFQRYNQLNDSTSHAADLIYREKCCEASNLCRYYELVRPRIQFCTFKVDVTLGFGQGDPHFATLDGLDYTFNGLGEYVLLKHNDANPKVNIQTRTARLTTEKGLSEATAFSAFVIKGLQNLVQVEIKGSGGMTVEVKIGDNNWIDLTEDFENNQLSFSENDLTLEREENTLAAIFISIGIRFSVSESNGVLKYGVSITGNEFKGKMVGLLGNFNGDKTDDLIAKGSTTPIPDTSNDREIFEQFGKSWITETEESLFKYPEGKDHDAFVDSNFIPKFLADIDSAKLQDAIAVCGENTECIFDLAVTENVNIASETKSAVEKAAEDKEIAANQIPSVTPSSGAVEKDGLYYIYTGINENKKIALVGEDDGTVTFELVESTAKATVQTPGAAGTAEINFSVENENPVTLSVIARDDKDATSPSIDFIIILCTGCNSRGVCDYENTRTDARETETFKYATCTCEQYYGGNDCENDFDGCSTQPCGARSCIDTVAADHKANPSLAAFTCGPCPSGYEADGFKCKDINECTDTSICDQVCTNTDGGYLCSCNSGYRLDTNNKDCNDINECEESSSGCEQICENTAGSFTCSCRPGFVLNAVTKGCDQSTPPTGCNTIDCSKAEGCTLDKDNNAVCFCKIGFELQADGTCKNIDECLTNPCDHTCKDNEGGFDCSCYVGYKLQDDKISCKTCEPSFYGLDCASKCECGVGSTGCDPVRGCVCSAGWTGTKCDNDVNECQTPGICSDPDTECVNRVGSYQCKCRAGFTSDGNGKCVDVNECNDIKLNTCEQTCTNTHGGFSCGCRSGYKVDPSDSKKCIDIDECADGVSDCEHTCLNNVGRYSCACKTGFILNDDRKTCTLSENPCAEFPDVSCAHICELVNDAPKCSCKIGFFLGDDDQACVDINECDPTKDLNKCTEKDKCSNVNGGYTCSCSPGFKLENDKLTCTACDSEYFGENCANECACGAGAEKCDPVTGCVCKEGWSGEKCDVDRDECVNSPCTAANTQCVNTPGSYECICKSGYKENANKICEDIDECKTTPGICDQQCDNTPGGYTCSCFAGFVRRDGKCEDIDECQGQNDCSQVCTNTVGSYRCSCNEGYTLDLTDRVTCTAAQTCDPNPCGANTDCAVISGTPKCACKAGFKFVSGSTTTCEDIAECDFDPSPCSQSCSETNGGYTCSCNLNGYKLDTDGTTCLECTGNTYGDDCTQTCSCVVANTESCSNVDGKCTCKEGWKGATCADNIDECPTVTCPEHSDCVDTDGSYYCKCRAGYILTSENKCQACNEGTYDENCAKTCDCITSNTETCNSVDGSCKCKSGWGGTICNENVNECSTNTDDCPQDSTCVDTQGSYVCNCNVGFIKATDGTCKACEQGSYGANCGSTCACVASNTASCNSVTGSCTCKDGWEGTTCNLNINECSRNTYNCPVLTECQDNDGSYICRCKTGYQKDSSGQCIDIDECKTGADNCLQKCDNTEGSFTCSCNIGYSGTGNDCTQCSGSWGEQCANPCNCNAGNTLRCDPVTGCVCKPGWTGATCTEDINECDTNPCGANEFCTNTQGSYLCNCNKGYVREQNICTACSNNAYGNNCGTSCNCVAANALVPTQSCNHIDGACECSAFWEGNRCQTNINECKRNTDNCTKENEGCHDIDGGFTCSCVDGYVYDTNNNCVIDPSSGITTAAPKPTFESVNIVLTFDYTTDDNLQVSLTLTLYKEEFKAKMLAYLLSVLGNVAITINVNSIKTGSLIADYNVVVPQTSLPDLATANADLISNTQNLDLFNQTSPVTGAIIQNVSLPTGPNAASDELTCESYEASINNCGSEYTCLIKNGKPFCEPVEDDNFPLAFGLGFGIPMFILCAIAFMVLVLFIRNRNKRRGKSEIPDDRSSSLFGHRLPVRIITGVPGPFSSSPEKHQYEPSDQSSEASDFDYRFERFDNDNGRPGQSTWNYLFHNSRRDDKYHIKRPKVDQEAWGRYAYDNYY